MCCSQARSVQTYNRRLALGLTANQVNDLAEYLRSL